MLISLTSAKRALQLVAEDLSHHHFFLCLPELQLANGNLRVCRHCSSLAQIETKGVCLLVVALPTPTQELTINNQDLKVVVSVITCLLFVQAG